MNAGALTGLRVLDLTRVLAGPWATQILADFGADVVKVERTGAGDDSRAWGPAYYRNEDGDRVSAYFCSANRGKRSFAVDFASPEGAAAIRRVAVCADVLVENFKVGALGKYGLDYESLRKANPRLIYCSITGFGQSGPYASRPGYDTIIQGLGGLMSLTGNADDSPGGGPLKVGAPLMDVLTGVYACNAILLAAIERERSGEGQRIDISLLDVQLAALSVAGGNFLRSGETPRRLGNELPNVVPSASFDCRDGQIMMMVGSDAQFATLCMLLERSDLATDSRFRTNESRVAHRHILMPIIRECFLHEDRAYWVEKLSAAGVPCGPVNELADVFNDPHVAHRESVVHIACPDGDDIRIVGNPIRLSRTPPVHKPPPLKSASHKEFEAAAALWESRNR